MDLQTIAVQMVKEKLGAVDEASIGPALESLLGDSGADLDLGGMVDKLSGSGVGGALASWLGDGDNDAVDGEEISKALGAEQIAEFAGNLGVGQGDAASALSSILPQLIDGSSSGGELISDVANLASRFFK